MEEFFLRFFRPLCYFSEGITGNKAEAEDIATRCLTSLWERKELLNNGDKARAYLYTSARNQCINYLRHQKVREGHRKATEETQLPVESSVESRIFEAELLQLVYNAIDRLPSKYRDVLNLVYRDGLSHQEAAERLSISKDSLKMRKARATAALRDALGKKDGLDSAAVLLILLPWLFD
nr:RNA polymerase sigma-70 factor [Filimonas effusa]